MNLKKFKIETVLLSLKNNYMGHIEMGLEMGLNRAGVEVFGSLFFKIVPFLANIEHCPKFLEYMLIYIYHI